MTESVVFAFVVLLFVWSVTSARLARADITGPALFLVAGLAVAVSAGGADVTVRSESVKALAEVTLALVLFSDAARIDGSSLRRQLGWSLRLLGIGLPLTIVAGMGVAMVVLGLPWPFAGLLAASLAATDAALSASLVTDERIPERLRLALNVESGLNDGLATPVVLFFVAASASLVESVGGSADAPTVASAVVELVGGAVVGAVIGFVGAQVLQRAIRAGWTGSGNRRIAVVALAFVTYLGALAVHLNGFVAVFVAGVALADVVRGDAVDDTEVPELVGEVLSLMVWFVFGAGLVLPVLEHLAWRPVVYAALSLTVVRMVPVALAMVRSGSGLRSSLFLGWFGPRGLASIVFALLLTEELAPDDPNVALVTETIAITVVLSAVAHGLSANPLTARLARTLTSEAEGTASGPDLVRARRRRLGPARR